MVVVRACFVFVLVCVCVRVRVCVCVCVCVCFQQPACRFSSLVCDQYRHRSARYVAWMVSTGIRARDVQMHMLTYTGFP